MSKRITARESAIRMLSARSHSSFELAQKLRRKGFSADEVDGVVEELKRSRIIDDLEFGKEYSNYRLERSFHGPELIRYELREKGLTQELIDCVLESIEEGQVLASAVKYLEKRINNKWESLSPDKRRTACVHALIKRGYPATISNKAYDIFIAADSY